MVEFVFGPAGMIDVVIGRVALTIRGVDTASWRAGRDAYDEDI
jgi:hypothetical protein